VAFSLYTALELPIGDFNAAQIVGGTCVGNTVVAKPAETTSLIAFRAIELYIKPGVPTDVPASFYRAMARTVVLRSPATNALQVWRSRLDGTAQLDYRTLAAVAWRLCLSSQKTRRQKRNVWWTLRQARTSRTLMRSFCFRVGCQTLFRIACLCSYKKTLPIELSNDQGAMKETVCRLAVFAQHRLGSSIG